MSGGSTAVNIPFTFVGCSALTVSSSPQLVKGGAGVSVACPPRSQRVVCLLRLHTPCRLTRVIVRNAGAVFLAVRSAAPSPQQLADWSSSGLLLHEAGVAAARQWSELVPEQQLCAAEVWRDSFHLRPLPAQVSRVHTFPSAGAMRGSFSPQLAESTTTALCVTMRGAEDEWNRDAQLGLSWLEVFGVPVEQ